MTTYKVIAERETTRLEVKKVEYNISLARTGGQGADNKTLGGLEVIPITDSQEGDLLTVSSNKWINIRRANVTDGGNF
jgi:hypothetical protein